MKKLFTFLLIIVLVKIANAQNVSRYFVVGPSLSSYKGDFSGFTKYSSAVEFSLIQNKDKKVRNILNFSAGKVIAQNSNDVYQGLQYNPYDYIQTNYLALNYTFNYFFIRAEHFKTYAGVGFGVFQFNPKDEYGNEVHSKNNNARLSSENYVLTKFMLPVQFGAIYTMKNNYGISLNMKWLNTKTDYLDNMSALANRNNNDNILLINVALVVPITDKK